MIHRKSIHICLGILLVASMGSAWSGEHPAPGQKPTKVDKELYDTGDQTIIKKSRNGICHDNASGAFSSTASFKASDEDCIDSGGRLPK